MSLLEECARFRNQARSESTVYTYAFAWKKFQEWCVANQREALPASTESVTLYLTHLITTGRKIATAHVRAAAIAYHHTLAGLPAPHGVTELLSGAQRLLCEQPVQKHPLSVAELRAICLPMSLSEDWLTIRNHAILTLGFASALRRSNLVALTLADVRFVEQGIVLHVRREKNDQLGKGRHIGVVKGEHPETCPVRAVQRWLGTRGDEPGPLFLPHPQYGKRHLWPGRIALVVKAGVKSIGLPAGSYAGHSLRSGLVTAAIESGAGELVVAKQTGHRSLDSLRRYFRATDLFRSNASAGVGL